MVSSIQKLEILGAQAGFDISLPEGKEANSSTLSLSTNTSLSSEADPHIYPSNAGNRIVPQFKVLLSNGCRYNCKYCFTQCARRNRIVTFTPEEYANLFIKYFLQKRVDSLFISSAIVKDPDYSTEKMLETVRLIREKYRYGGYIHFKCLPGTSRDLLTRASHYVDRMSVNLEAPTASRLSEVAPDKDFQQDLLLRQQWIHEFERKGKLSAGQTTQFVVGVAGESDEELLDRVDELSRRIHIRRAYFSAFRPLKGSPLESQPATPSSRTVRLYQADYLLRRYGFHLEEIQRILTDEGNLPEGDPKVHLAREFFDPSEKIEVNEAPLDLLLRVPGIGFKSAKRILQLQQKHAFIKKPLDLKKLGVQIDRALPFLKISGQMQTSIDQFVAIA